MENNKQDPLNVSRRVFLQVGLWVSGLASAWGIFKFLSFEPPKEELLPSITLDLPFAYSKGIATYIPEVKAWLLRDDEGLFAVSATCTHLGCTVGGDQGKFICPCHGSQFDFSGQVLQGPAAKRLPTFEVSLSDDGHVVIDRRIEVPHTYRLKPE